MAISPSGSPSSKRSITATRRSTVSAAANHGPSQETSSAGSHQSLSKRISVPTVGTMVNPAATASELFAISPSMSQPQSTSARDSTGPSAVPSATFPISVKQSVAVPSTLTAQASQTHGRSKTQSPSDMQPQQPPTSAQPSVVSSMQPKTGGGLVAINVRAAAIIQVCFALLAIAAFLSLWIYLLAFANCINSLPWEVTMKGFALAGGVAGLVVLFHSCFEHKVSTRGVCGCIIFFIIAGLVFAHILVAFQAMNCICRCAGGGGEIAWTSGRSEDLTIFVLSLVGAFSLVIILLVASVSHE